MKTINHYGVTDDDGYIDGKFVPAASIIRVPKEVPDREALKWLTSDKRLIHKVLDHRRSVHHCRESVCGQIQEDIDAVEAGAAVQ